MILEVVQGDVDVDGSDVVGAVDAPPVQAAGRCGEVHGGRRRLGDGCEGQHGDDADDPGAHREQARPVGTTVGPREAPVASGPGEGPERRGHHDHRHDDDQDRRRVPEEADHRQTAPGLIQGDEPQLVAHRDRGRHREDAPRQDRRLAQSWAQGRRQDWVDDEHEGHRERHHGGRVTHRSLDDARSDVVQVQPGQPEPARHPHRQRRDEVGHGDVPLRAPSGGGRRDGHGHSFWEGVGATCESCVSSGEPPAADM